MCLCECEGKVCVVLSEYNNKVSELMCICLCGCMLGQGEGVCVVCSYVGTITR